MDALVLREAWTRLDRSLHRLSEACEKASPRVRQHHGENLRIVRARVAALEVEMEQVSWVAKQLTHLMEDWLHTWWITDQN